jgi:hypothetical protein
MADTSLWLEGVETILVGCGGVDRPQEKAALAPSPAHLSLQRRRMGPLSIRCVTATVTVIVSYDTVTATITSEMSVKA